MPPRPIRFLFLTAACLSAPTLPAQQPMPDPTLEQILLALQQNVGDYIHSLPNLYCDEHVISDFDPHDPRNLKSHSVVDATFRIRRPPNVRTLADLQESRDIKLVDGEPLVDELGFTKNSDLPLLILGVFANGPALFSPALAPCFNFTLAPPHEHDEPSAVAVAFTSRPAKDRPATCPNDHSSTGRALVDRTSLHLLQLEKTTPSFPIYPHIQGTWAWTVDYTPTPLAGRTFFLPAHIHSRSIGNHRNGEWTFDAAYTNYHRLLASSRIVPSTSPAPKP